MPIRGWLRTAPAAAVMFLVAVALLVMPISATPAERIVVHGAASGSHLKLTVGGGEIVVSGYMASASPTGCRLEQNRMTATCPFQGVASIELNMGPTGDRVEVLDRLPIPLTVHLGDGSDKFIGNGERDTCYPEGARRNRCIGEGGNDVCITGPDNSDCVGGGGDDYCETSTGSDGCWGGPGDDVCHMGPGEDGCHGDAGDDELYGGGDPDQLYGGRGFDHCDGTPGFGRSRACEAGPRR